MSNKKVWHSQREVSRVRHPCLVVRVSCTIFYCRVGHGEESRVAGYRQLRLRSFSRVQEWLDQRSDRSTGSVLKRQALRPGAEKADNAEFGYLIVHIRMVQVAVAHPSAYRWRFCCRGWPWCKSVRPLGQVATLPH